MIKKYVWAFCFSNWKLFNCSTFWYNIGDSVAVEQKLNRFKGLDHTFGTSRECQFVEKLMSVRLFIIPLLFKYFI